MVALSRMRPRTVYAVLESTAETRPEDIALHQPTGGGKYKTWTWRQYRSAVQQIAVGLRAIGLRKGEIVALQSETRAEFYLADLGVMSAGAIAAALYTSLPFPDQAKTLEASGARFVFVENPKAMKALKAAAPNFHAEWILLSGEESGVLTLEDVRAKGEERISEFESIIADAMPDDHAILYMTSGATGEPKMGLVTHAAVVANMDHAPRRSAPHTRRRHHRVSSLGAHRAARSGGNGSHPPGNAGVVFRRSLQAAQRNPLHSSRPFFWRHRACGSACTPTSRWKSRSVQRPCENSFIWGSASVPRRAGYASRGKKFPP